MILPDHILRRMDPRDRPKGKAGWTAKETHARMLRKLERDEQQILASWLALREADKILVYDWSRTDRRTTNRTGMPDFRLYARGRVLLGEMKLGGGKLSEAQSALHEKFRASGTQVQIWTGAANAIEAIRDWLAQL